MNSTQVDIERALDEISFATIQSVHTGNRSAKERDLG